jgi:hypothetical protein
MEGLAISVSESSRTEAVAAMDAGGGSFVKISENGASAEGAACVEDMHGRTISSPGGDSETLRRQYRRLQRESEPVEREYYIKKTGSTS